MSMVKYGVKSEDIPKDICPVCGKKRESSNKKEQCDCKKKEKDNG